MFYDKKIDLYQYKKVKENHETISKYIKINDEPIECDIQPTSSEKFSADYGYSIKVTNKIYLDPNKEVIENSLIEIEGNFFSVQKIIKWDDYWIVGILDCKRPPEVEDM